MAYDVTEERLKVKGSESITRDLQVTGDVYVGGELTVDNSTVLTEADKGVSNGVATLDATGRVPYSQLPESAMEYKGTWDASTNTPMLTDGIGTNGDFYVVSAAGTVNFGAGRSITFYINDRVIYDGTTSQWARLPAGEVRSVNGQSGDVVLSIPAAQVNSDWNATSGVAQILNKPTIADIVADGNMNAITSNAVYNDVVKYETTDTFTTAFLRTNVNVTRTCVFNNKIYIGTTSSGIYISSDGVTFTQNTSFPTDYGVRGRMYVFGGKMYVGTNGHGLYESSDGVTFTQNTSIPSSSTVQPGGTYNGKIYVGVNSNGIYVSSDGVTFTQNTSFPTTYTATTFVEYNNNFYVITGGFQANMNKGIYVSSDGVTFTQNTSFPTDYGSYSATVYNNKLYIGTNGHGLYESSDGVTFTQNTSFQSTHNVQLLIVYNNWLYIGTTHDFHKTNDGITYINVVTSAGISGTGYQAVEKNGLLYVAFDGYGLMVNSINQSTFMDVLFKLFATKEHIDTTVTQNSDNLVTSGAVYDAIAQGGGGDDWATTKQNIADELGLTASQYNGNSATATTAYKIRTSAPSSPSDGDIWLV